MRQPVTAHVDPRHIQRVGGNIRRVDARLAKIFTQQYRQAAGAGAKIQRAADAAFRGPTVDRLLQQQFRNIGARHQRALIDVKAVRPEPGFLG